MYQIYICGFCALDEIFACLCILVSNTYINNLDKQSPFIIWMSGMGTINLLYMSLAVQILSRSVFLSKWHMWDTDNSLALKLHQMSNELQNYVVIYNIIVINNNNSVMFTYDKFTNLIIVGRLSAL